MNSKKYLGLLTFICLLFIFSCSSDDAEECAVGFSGANCEVYCNQGIPGTWNVTDIRPIGCTLLSYQFELGSGDNIISMTLDEGDRLLTGNGLLQDDCSEMTYTVSNGATIVSGTIVFTDNTLEDRSGLGCLIYATKQ
jgi:hypothetical protein